MPLDVQPLSPARRIVMLLVLIALLGASVGFAQFLVARSHAGPKLAWNFPADFKPVDRDADDPEEVQISALGHVAGQERLLRGIVIDIPSRLNAGQQLNLTRAVFESFIDAPPSIVRPAPIAGRVGLELDGATETGEFAFLRMAIIQNRAIAICYSGAGTVTDLDKLYFNNLCQRVVLQPEPPAKRK